MKGKNHTVTSIDAVKAFDKTQNPFVIKTLNKIVQKGARQHTRAVCEKPTANVVLRGDTESFPSLTQGKGRVSSLSFPSLH